MKAFMFIRQFVQERLFLYRLFIQNAALRHPRAGKTLV